MKKLSDSNNAKQNLSMLESHIPAPLTCLPDFLPPKMIEISTFKIKFSAFPFSTEHEDSVWSGSSGNNLTHCP